jgi:hypothetical protein
MKYLDKLHFRKILAFAMGHHSRLGVAFQGTLLSDGDMQMIMLSYCGLPFDYLNKSHAHECKYVNVTEATGFQRSHLNEPEDDFFF